MFNAIFRGGVCADLERRQLDLGALLHQDINLCDKLNMLSALFSESFLELVLYHTKLHFTIYNSASFEEALCNSITNLQTLINENYSFCICSPCLHYKEHMRKNSMAEELIERNLLVETTLEAMTKIIDTGMDCEAICSNPYTRDIVRNVIRNTE